MAVCAVTLTLSLGMMAPAQAAVVDLMVTLNIINVVDDQGNAAQTLGTPFQQQSIMDVVNTIWNEAGIGVEIKNTTVFTDPAALNGGYSSVSSLVNAGRTAGVLDSDPLVLNVFMVDIRPGDVQYGTNYVAGVAGLGWNGIAFYIGTDLMSWSSWPTIGRVLAHEIGHNLGLPHYDEIVNLMSTSGGNFYLTQAQIDTARNSVFAVAIPEPATLVLLTVGGLWLNRRRRAA